MGVLGDERRDTVGNAFHTYLQRLHRWPGRRSSSCGAGRRRARRRPAPQLLDLRPGHRWTAEDRCETHSRRGVGVRRRQQPRRECVSHLSSSGPPVAGRRSRSCGAGRRRARRRPAPQLLDLRPGHRWTAEDRCETHSRRGVLGDERRQAPRRECVSHLSSAVHRWPGRRLRRRSSPSPAALTRKALARPPTRRAGGRYVQGDRDRGFGRGHLRRARPPARRVPVQIRPAPFGQGRRARRRPAPQLLDPRPGHPVDLLKIGVKRIPDGVFSAFVADRLGSPGDTLDVMTPTGTFSTRLNPTQAKRATPSPSPPDPASPPCCPSWPPRSRWNLPTAALVFGNCRTSTTMFLEEAPAPEEPVPGPLPAHPRARRPDDRGGNAVGAPGCEPVRADPGDHPPVDDVDDGFRAGRWR